jgi:hypothetical protein
VSETDNLKGQIGTGITKVLEEKLKRGKSRGIRTTLVALEKLRSLGEQTSDPDQVDVWTRSLVDKGVAYLQSEAWKTQKAGIAILSALAQTRTSDICWLVQRASFDPLFQNMAWTPSSHTSKIW